MQRIAVLIAEWERARAGILEYVDAMPADGLGFRPTPGVYSFAEQMLHVAEAHYAFAAAACGVPNPREGTDVAERDDLKGDAAALRAFVAGAYDFLLAGLRDLEAGALDDEVPFYRTRLPRWLLLAKALEHHAHHRGQTTVYLRLRGVTPPRERLF
jgi:uncharacterized damage-inducible protein DinB